MKVLAAAKRQYRLQLRPDEVLSEAKWAKRMPPYDKSLIWHETARSDG